MICGPEPTLADPSALVAHIASEIDELCGHLDLVQDGQVEELARAVAHFLEQQGQSASVDSRYLVMLASRAMQSVGEDDAARRLLVFGTELVKPSEWEVTGGESVWVLDLHQMTTRDDDSLELAFFNSLSVVLQSVADVWDASNGQGLLGLRHVCASARGLLGESRDKSLECVSEEIKTFVAARLAQVSESRHWQHVPRVMDLDIRS